MVSTFSGNNSVSKAELVDRVQAMLDPGFTLEGLRRNKHSGDLVLSIRYMCPMTGISVSRSMNMTTQAVNDLVAISGDMHEMFDNIIVVLIGVVRSGYASEMCHLLRANGKDPFVLVQGDFRIDSPKDVVSKYAETFRKECQFYGVSKEDAVRYRDRYLEAIGEKDSIL
jgi:hypothetical protein